MQHATLHLKIVFDNACLTSTTFVNIPHSRAEVAAYQIGILPEG